MSMQSHLAELEKRHQALESEINDCLTHPAVDDLKVVELKRKKLLLRMRSSGCAITATPACTDPKRSSNLLPG